MQGVYIAGHIYTLVALNVKVGIIKCRFSWGFLFHLLYYCFLELLNVLGGDRKSYAINR